MDTNPDLAKWCGSDPMQIWIHKKGYLCRFHGYWIWESLLNSDPCVPDPGEFCQCGSGSETHGQAYLDQ
jgi:hypothetical protein